MTQFNRELLEILCCPKDKGELSLRNEETLECNTCKTRFAIKEGIPILLEKE